MLNPVISYLIGLPLGAFVFAVTTRPFKGQRDLLAAKAEVTKWRDAYNAEVKDRLAGIDAIHSWRRTATAAVHRVDRLRSLLNNAHYRNPETGRLSPRGEFPEEIK